MAAENNQENGADSGADLTITLRVSQTPAQVFTAINKVRDWWSGAIEGNTDRLGSEWTYRYQDIHYSKQKITELIPDCKIVWHVEESYLQFVENTNEWDGTDIIFEITNSDGQTELRFTHKGLTPSIACYDGCSPAWRFYIEDALQQLITTGLGSPNID